MESVEVKFKYTEKEYVTAARKYLVVSKTIRITDICIAVMLLLLGFFSYIFLSVDNLSIIFMVCGLLYLAIICMLYFIIPQITFKQNKKFQEEYSLTFSNLGILFKTNTIHSELQWNVYCDFLENEEFYYLLQNKRVYSIIPKSAFESTESRQLFEKIVRANIKVR